MCCYVGKATKIFLCLVAALLVAGLVLGFGLAHRTWGGQKAQPSCSSWPHCQTDEPVYGGGPLLPAAGATNAPPNSLTQPAVAAFPGGVTSSAAPPTTSMPYFGPPNPFAVGLGPTAHI
ncbi:hypothetical protein PR202_gb14281 [Eleusine coracana subsp. coracana]|uniref:Uncharacterized protein n=1 Tax=Eleusine coracana subsp. coracana TaxID=191504 RepID=A0AAV5EVW2_ELECO|nr:hypothetical protein PR202_gb14281 [Eleusine coracana subsp. coracana]